MIVLTLHESDISKFSKVGGLSPPTVPVHTPANKHERAKITLFPIHDSLDKGTLTFEGQLI